MLKMSPKTHTIVDKCVRVLQALAVSCTVYYGIFCETKYAGVIETAKLTQEQNTVFEKFKVMSAQDREVIANDILALNMNLNEAVKSIMATKYDEALKEVADAEKLINHMEKYGIPLAKEKKEVEDLKVDLAVIKKTA